MGHRHGTAGKEVNPERAWSGSQFSAGLVTIHLLDGRQAVSGRVVEGLELAKAVAVGDEVSGIAFKGRQRPLGLGRKACYNESVQGGETRRRLSTARMNER